jgi:V8-like Glu-specific endopeptidase
MFRRRATSVALLVTLLVAVAAAPSAAVDRGWAAHLRTIAHWTPERLRSALPRDASLVPGRGFVLAKGKPGGGSGGTVTGASWTKTDTTVYHATGRVYFELGSNAYVCSGAVVQDTRSGYALVLTAAHCAYDETNGTFATNWLFIPEFDSSPTYACSNTAYGCWTAIALVVHNGYASAGSFNSQATRYDYAIAVVGPGGKNGDQLDATVGDFPIRFSAVADGTQTYAFGYPAAGKYNGTDLVYCAGPIGSDPYNGNRTYALACDMTGGSSGGPWFTGFDTTSGTGTLTSVNSYTYRSVKNTMHGPKFDFNTQAIYGAADSATSNTIVGP